MASATGVLAPVRRVADRHPGATRTAFRVFVIACVLIDIAVIWRILDGGGFRHDSYAFWSVDLSAPYRGSAGERDAFLYSPAVAQVLSIVGHLPWMVFLVGWTVLQVAIVVWLAGRDWWWVLPLPPVLFECIVGNVHLLYAAAIRLGFRHPWTWALMLLTKVTPGVGLLWFAVRREWRALGIALGATAVIVLVSYVLAPDLWHQWADVLAARSDGDIPELTAVHVPLWSRVLLAALIVAWGAWTDRPWVLPIAVLLAQPVIWLTSLSILVAVLPLRGAAGREIAAAGAAHGRRAWYRA